MSWNKSCSKTGANCQNIHKTITYRVWLKSCATRTCNVRILAYGLTLHLVSPKLTGNVFNVFTWRAHKQKQCTNLILQGDSFTFFVVCCLSTRPQNEGRGGEGALIRGLRLFWILADRWSAYSKEALIRGRGEANSRIYGSCIATRVITSWVTSVVTVMAAFE